MVYFFSSIPTCLNHNAGIPHDFREKDATGGGHVETRIGGHNAENCGFAFRVLVEPLSQLLPMIGGRGAIDSNEPNLNRNKDVGFFE